MENLLFYQIYIKLMNYLHILAELKIYHLKKIMEKIFDPDFMTAENIEATLPITKISILWTRIDFIILFFYHFVRVYYCKYPYSGKCEKSNDESYQTQANPKSRN